MYAVNVANEQMALFALIPAAVLYIVTVVLIVVGMVKVARTQALTTGAQSLLFSSLGLALMVIFICPVAELFISLGF